MVVVLTLFVVARWVGSMTPEKAARSRIRRAAVIASVVSTVRGLRGAIDSRLNANRSKELP
jgi:hypothetical protein